MSRNTIAEITKSSGTAWRPRRTRNRITARSLTERARLVRDAKYTAHPEPFDSTLILSLSKDERAAQDRLVEDELFCSWFNRYILSELALRQAQGERVEGLTTSENVWPLERTQLR